MDEEKSVTVPRDARTIEAILKSMGVEEYDPRVVQQLLEFLYRYVTTILTESRQFSDHADKPQIDVDDIKLAIRSRCNHSFTQPPPRDVTMRLAAERNSIPLPPIDSTAGLALPPKDFQLTAQNYDVIVEPKARASPKRPRLSASPRKSSTASPAKSPKNLSRSASSPRNSSNQASPTRSIGQQPRSSTATPTRPSAAKPADPDVMIIDPPAPAPARTKTPPAATQSSIVNMTTPDASKLPPATLPPSVPVPGINTIPTTTSAQATKPTDVVDVDAPADSAMPPP